MRGVSANMKSCTSVPSGSTAWARIAGRIGLQILKCELRAVFAAFLQVTVPYQRAT